MVKKNAALKRLQEFLDSIPANGNINWDDLNEKKEIAQLSINHLAKIVGGSDERNQDEGKSCPNWFFPPPS